MKKLLLSVVLPALGTLLTFAACVQKTESLTTSPEEVEGWVPVYSAGTGTIKSADVRATTRGGKIHLKDHMLYQVETGAGIHAIDITNPDAPRKVAFVEIPGCQELSVQNNLLYANNHNDLVVVDITNLTSVSEVGRVPSAFNIIANRPPGSGWAECIDPAKGTVVTWDRGTLHHPTCYF